jgi:uncharacterized protein (TIGR02246 family)
MVATLARLGIVPGKGFDATRLDPAATNALADVPAAAFGEIMTHEADAGEDVNGWTFSTRTGLYGTDYLQRAFVTAIGLGANRPEDAIYPKTGVDSDGKPLSGANHYLMHFPAGQTPPVNGFWSLTMYDAAYFFVANPLNRYTLSPRNALKYNPDGSLDLLIGQESPGKDWESNWLPAPKGEFTLMMRLYWPKEAVIAGRWAPPAVRQVADSAPDAKAPARPEDTKAIAALDTSFIAAFNRGDARSIADLFTDDAEISDDSGETVRGREAISRHFAATFEDDPKAKIELTPDSLRFLGADAAKQTGRARTIPGNGGSPEITRFTVLYVRRDGRWLHDTIHEHEDRNLTSHDRLTELEWLVGDWVDEGDDGVVHTSCRWSDDKNFLLRDFTMHVAGMPVSRGSQRIGWDAKKGQIRSWVFDGDGGHSEGFWTRSGKDEWTIRAVGILSDGRDVQATQVLTFVSKGLCRWRSIDREIDSEPVPDLPEIVLVRTPPRPGGSARAAK